MDWSSLWYTRINAIMCQKWSVFKSQHLSPLDLPNMSQTIFMSFPVAPKTFPTFRTSFLRLLDARWVWILPWNIEKFHIAKPEYPIGCSGSTETHGGMSSSSVHRKLLLLHFLYRKTKPCFSDVFPEFCVHVCPSIATRPFHASYHRFRKYYRREPTTLLSFLTVTSRHVVMKTFQKSARKCV